MAEADEKGQMTKAYGFNPTTMQLGLWSTDPIWQAETPNGSLTDPKARYDWLHTDHLGTPILATTEEGQTSWRAVSESFGATLPIDQDIEMNLRFPGQYFDEETGTHYNFHRDYRPNAGRYLQSDPIGLEGGVNLYLYVGARPVNKTDIYGLFTSTADYAFMWHFWFNRSGNYYNISSWCKTYTADPQVKIAINIIKLDIMIHNKKLLGLNGETSYQIKNNKRLYIDPMSFWSFGAGNGHMQDADCVAIGDGCCVESKCQLKVKAFDSFTDPIDLCQRWGVCGNIKEIGGVPFYFGLSCPVGEFSVKDCKNG